MPKLEQKQSVTNMVYFANFIQNVDALRRKKHAGLPALPKNNKNHFNCSTCLNAWFDYNCRSIGATQYNDYTSHILKKFKLNYFSILIVNHLKKTFLTIAKRNYKL